MAINYIEEAIFSILKNNDGVKGLVVSRIYPSVRPQGSALPAVTFEQAGGERQHDLAAPIGMVDGNYTITGWASTYAGARQLADCIRLALDGYSGTIGNVPMLVFMLGSETDILEEIAEAKLARTYGKRQTYRVWWREST